MNYEARDLGSDDRNFPLVFWSGEIRSDFDHDYSDYKTHFVFREFLWRHLQWTWWPLIFLPVKGYLSWDLEDICQLETV